MVRTWTDCSNTRLVLVLRTPESGIVIELGRAVNSGVYCKKGMGYYNVQGYH